MNNKRVCDIKRAQKASLLLRVISQLFLEVTLDNKELQGFFVNRVDLSPDKSICYVYFCTTGGPEEFKQKLDILKLYKPSMRASLSRQIASRYTPEIVFKFDSCAEKVEKIDRLLQKLKDNGDL